MSLRARLVLGMALIAGVLIVTAVVITRTTEANLIHQVDARLETAEPPRFDGRGPGRATSDDDPTVYSDAFFAEETASGQLEIKARPNLGGTKADPRIPVSKVDDADGRPFTVGSSDEDLRYRALVTRREENILVPGRGLVTTNVTSVVALPLSDLDASVSRLVKVEIAVTAAVL